MGPAAAASVQATMKFTFERLSRLLLTHAIRFKPQAIRVAMDQYGVRGAMYHGSMLLAGMYAEKSRSQLLQHSAMIFTQVI